MREGFTLAALFGSAAIAALLIATPPQEASASVLCEHRSAAHIAEHGGITEDSRWHIARGELANCDDDQPAESSKDEKASPDQDTSDRKSRHCRKSWYC